MGACPAVAVLNLAAVPPVTGVQLGLTGRAGGAMAAKSADAWTTLPPTIVSTDSRLTRPGARYVGPSAA